MTRLHQSARAQRAIFLLQPLHGERRFVRPHVWNLNREHPVRDKEPWEADYDESEAGRGRRQFTHVYIHASAVLVADGRLAAHFPAAVVQRERTPRGRDLWRITEVPRVETGQLERAWAS